MKTKRPTATSGVPMLESVHQRALCHFPIGQHSWWKGCCREGCWDRASWLIRQLKNRRERGTAAGSAQGGSLQERSAKLSSGFGFFWTLTECTILLPPVRKNHKSELFLSPDFVHTEQPQSWQKIKLLFDNKKNFIFTVFTYTFKFFTNVNSYLLNLISKKQTFFVRFWIPYESNLQKIKS